MAQRKRKSGLRIGERVRALRLARRWTQAELARKLDLSQARLSEVERGDGSFTAEQFIAILGLFNVPVSHFAHTQSVDPENGLQNALAHLGANHLHVTPHVPGDRAVLAGDAVREALLGGSPRMVTALAPVLVHNASRISLPRVDASLRGAGLDRRLPWLVDNVVEALRGELTGGDMPRAIGQRYRRALVVLEAFQDATRGREPPPPDSGQTPDILDETIRSKETLAQVQAGGSPISRRWHVVTRLAPQDFREALKAASVAG